MVIVIVVILKCILFLCLLRVFRMLQCFKHSGFLEFQNKDFWNSKGLPGLSLLCFLNITSCFMCMCVCVCVTLFDSTYSLKFRLLCCSLSRMCRKADQLLQTEDQEGIVTSVWSWILGHDLSVAWGWDLVCFCPNSYPFTQNIFLNWIKSGFMKWINS